MKNAEKQYLQEKLKRLKVVCKREYQKHYLNGYPDIAGKNDKESKKFSKKNTHNSLDKQSPGIDVIKPLFQEIMGTQWENDSVWLEERKAKACFYIGEVLHEEGAYDHALSYLEQAEGIIVKHSLQFVIPKTYIRTKLYMGKCYMEKHCKSAMINQCHLDAEKILSRAGEKCRNTLKYEMLVVELELQKAIAELDPYGEKREGVRDRIWKFLSTQTDLDSFWKSDDSVDTLEVQKYLDKADKTYIAVQKRLLSGASQWKTAWLQKQQDTLIATKASFLKEMYFDIKRFEKEYGDKKAADQDFEYVSVCVHKLQSVLNNWELKKGRTSKKTEKEYRNIKEEICSDLDIQIRELLRSFFVLAFEEFEEGINCNDKSTICLGNLAILKYEYDHEAILNCNDEFDMHIKSSESVNQILERVIEIESNNMFALNMLAMGMGVDKNDVVDTENDTYSALRHSSLKRYFNRIDNFMGEYQEKSDHPNWRYDELRQQVRNLKKYMILSYNSVMEYMDSAVVDTRSDNWKGKLVGHYTRKEVLAKLINKDPDSRMRLGNVRHLNDPLEGLQFIRQFPKVHEDSFTKKLFEAYSLEEQGKYRSSVYMSSFTTRVDQLNMWTRYGDRGNGCCIQVDASETFDCNTKVPLVFAAEDKKVVIMEDKRYPLYAVLYLPDHLKWNKLCGSEKEPEEAVGIESDEITYTRLLEYYSKRSDIELSDDERDWWGRQATLLIKLENLRCNLIKYFSMMDKITATILQPEGIDEAKDDEFTANLKKQLVEEARNALMVILDLVRFLIKSDHYREEREYRVIQYSSDPDYEEVKGTSPSLFIKMEKELAYKRICYGPNVKEFNSDAAYGVNIRKAASEEGRGKNWRIEAYKSAIPYQDR